MGISKLFSNMKLKLIKHRPEILLGTGLLSIAGGVVLVCNASRKVDDVISEASEEIDRAKAELTGVDSDKAVRKEQGKCAWELFKMYAPGAGLLVAGTVLVIKSHGEMGERVAAIGMALNDTAAAFMVYRGNVVDRYGEEVDKDLLYSRKPVEIVNFGYTDEDGVEHPDTTEIVNTVDIPAISIEFDRDNVNWSDSKLYNQHFLASIEDMANKDLIREGKYFVFQLKTALGMKAKIRPVDYTIGWFAKEGDKSYEYDPKTGKKLIDLGIAEAAYVREDERGYSYDVSYVLTPNIQGYILDKF